MPPTNRLAIYYQLLNLSDQWQHRGSSDPCRLWVTCSEKSMDGAVRKIQRTSYDLVLRVPGGGIGESANGITLFSAALDQFPINEIVLCGHATCSAIGQDVDDFLDGRSAGPLMERAIARMSRNNRARRLIADQMESLSADARIAAAMKTRELQVTGMFYLEESGSFTLYDPDARKFTGIRA